MKKSNIYLFYIAIGLILLNIYVYKNINAYNPTYLALCALSIRILVTILCVDVAKETSRSVWVWGFITFLLPIVALIILGLRSLNIKNMRLIKELQKLPSGYYRLVITGWILIPVTLSIMMGLLHQLEEAVFTWALSTLAYYIVVRWFLWIREGFKRNSQSSHHEL